MERWIRERKSTPLKNTRNREYFPLPVFQDSLPLWQHNKGYFICWGMHKAARILWKQISIVFWVLNLTKRSNLSMKCLVSHQDFWHAQSQCLAERPGWQGHSAREEFWPKSKQSRPEFWEKYVLSPPFPPPQHQTPSLGLPSAVQETECS